MYKVKVWDKNGNVTERMVDVSKVDTKSCDYIDMFAYSSHLSASGKCPGAQSAFIRAGANQHGFDNKTHDDLFGMTDWISVLKDAMQTQYDAGNKNSSPANSLCQESTQKGTGCRRYAVDGSNKCHDHRKITTRIDIGGD